MSQKTLTLRMPADLYRRVRANLRKSLNAFVVEAVEEKLVREREEEIKKGLQSLVGSVDEEELERWLDAQREAWKLAED